MGDYGTYCGTELVVYLSQVKWDQLKTYFSEALLNSFIVGTLIPEAEKIVDTYCNHGFGTPSYGTFTLDGSGKDVLFWPPKWTPLIGLGAGSVSGVGVTIGGAYNSTGVKVYDQYLRYNGGIFNTGKLNCVFYGSYGYLSEKDGTVPIVPRDVEYVTGQIAANVLADLTRRARAPDVMMDLMQGGGAGDVFRTLFAHPDVFPPSLQRKLDPYVIKWVDIG